MRYEFSKLYTLSPQSGLNHVGTQIKYCCARIPTTDEEARIPSMAELTDDVPSRLFRQIASQYQKGEVVTTIAFKSITSHSSSKSVTITEPLSHDEMFILANEILLTLDGK